MQQACVRAGKVELITGIDGASSRPVPTCRTHFARKCLTIQFRNPDRRQTAFALSDRFIGYTRSWHVWQSQTVRSSG